jgi:uncharacterized phage-associated protein
MKVGKKKLKSYPALHVANSLIKLAIENKNPLTQISVLKLLYFANAAYLVVNKIPLIEEKFQAWRFGPVLEDLYRYYLKVYGAKPINNLLTLESEELDNDVEAQQVLKVIFDNYSNYSPFDLVALTHSRFGAWHKAYYKESFSVISDKDIIEEYKNIIEVE